MSRSLAFCIAATLLLPACGCVAVSAKGNRFANQRQVVVFEGRLLVVDTCEGTVQEITPSIVKPFQRQESANNVVVE